MATALKKPVAKNKSRARPKLTDADRHARFVKAARDVQASEEPEDFEKAFKKIVPLAARRTEVPFERENGYRAQMHVDFGRY